MEKITADSVRKYSPITNMVGIVLHIEEAAKMLEKQKSFKARLKAEQLRYTIWMLHVAFPEGFREPASELPPPTPLYHELSRREDEKLKEKYPEWYAEREARKNKRGATA